MAIETICQSCGNRLRVGDQHAGKLARCPGCQTVYTVPAATMSPAMPTRATTGGARTASPSAQAALGGSPFGTYGSLHGEANNGKWHLKTPDGLTYGPVTRHELDQWQREGRVTAQSQVLNEADGRWTWAGQLYPQLQSLVSDAPKPVVSQSLNPYAPSVEPYGQAASGGWLEPHHGAVVLTLGIVGLLFCGVLAWVAVILAIIDLNKMAKGTMDPGGRGLTIVGLVCGALKVAMQAFFLLAVVLDMLL